MTILARSGVIAEPWPLLKNLSIPGPAPALRQLEDQGFAVVRSLFTAADVAAANGVMDDVLGQAQAYVKQHPDKGRLKSLIKSSDDQPEVRYTSALEPRLLQTEMFRKCARFAREIAGSVGLRFDHLIVKEPWNRSITPWHQDEAFQRSAGLWRQRGVRRLHFWIPLQDVELEGGCMEFLPGSHRRPPAKHEAYVQPDGSRTLHTTPANVHEVVACPIGAGGLTIHTPRTLHRAGQNKTGRRRKAWILHFSHFHQLDIIKRAVGDIPGPFARS